MKIGVLCRKFVLGVVESTVGYDLVIRGDIKYSF